jgi:hypothetical protein
MNKNRQGSLILIKAILNINSHFADLITEFNFEGKQLMLYNNFHASHCWHYSIYVNFNINDVQYKDTYRNF